MPTRFKPKEEEEKKEEEPKRIILLEYGCKYCGNVWTKKDEPPPVQRVWVVCTRCFKMIANVPRKVEQREIMPTLYEYLGDKFPKF